MDLFADDAARLGQPYWWGGIDWPELERGCPETADLVIIGAGYTGLSAAIAAHDAGAKVVVIEAGTPGKGASTRNGGMVGAHPRLDWHALARTYGADLADALFAEAAPALQFVLDLIAHEDIDCDYQKTGRIQLAWTKAHFDNHKRLLDTIVTKSQVRAQLVTKAELAAHIATPLYKGGILFPDHGALNPAKFHQGLLRAVLRRGVPVVARTPVTGLNKAASGFRVQTPKHSLRAAKVVLATNGYTRAPFDWFTRRVFPLPSYILATETLAPDLIRDLAPGGHMMVETRARHSYYRISPDGTRILFGGRASMINLDLRQAAKRLHNTMTEIWPRLKGTKVSHIWTGNTGFSFDHLPQVGAREGLHYAMGFSGSGTVMAPYLGAKAAWQALGDARGTTAYSYTELSTRWFHPGGRPHFLRAGEVWYRTVVDRAETCAAK